jgi:hypothetical protein
VRDTQEQKIAIFHRYTQQEKCYNVSVFL